MSNDAESVAAAPAAVEPVSAPAAVQPVPAAVAGSAPERAACWRSSDSRVVAGVGVGPAGRLGPAPSAGSGPPPVVPPVPPPGPSSK
jgi:hypothetical protein